MMMLSLVLVALVAFGLIWVLRKFDAHVEAKFDHSFLSMGDFIVVCLWILLIVGGNWWRESASNNGGDPLNGIVVMALGVLVFLWTVIKNVRRTNLPYAAVGSPLQVGLFGSLAWFGWQMILVGLILLALGTRKTIDVNVVN